MATLLLLLTTTHAAAAGPAYEGPHVPPPPRRTLCDRLIDGYKRFGLVISGAACSYNRKGIPVSNGPTPSYARYLQGQPHPSMAAPAPSAPAVVEQKPK